MKGGRRRNGETTAYSFDFPMTIYFSFSFDYEKSTCAHILSFAWNQLDVTPTIRTSEKSSESNYNWEETDIPAQISNNPKSNVREEKRRECMLSVLNLPQSNITMPQFLWCWLVANNALNGEPTTPPTTNARNTAVGLGHAAATNRFNLLKYTLHNERTNLPSTSNSNELQ